MTLSRFNSIISASFFSIPLLFLSIWNPRAVYSGDWPGHLGPNRNGVASSDEKVAQQLDVAPQVDWTIPAGMGYAGASISDNQVCLFDHLDQQERLRLVSLDKGSLIWEKRYPSTYRGGMDSDHGPRCVPTILQEAIVLYSAAGELTLVNRRDGATIWTRALRKEYGADDGYFGAGSTPLVIADLIVVNVGSKNGGVVAVSIEDGKDVWKTDNSEASYASPIFLTIKGKSRVLVPTRLKTILLDPTDGKVLSEIRFGARGPSVVAATPIPIDAERIFLTSSYGVGTLVVDSQSDRLIEVLRNGLMNSQYATPVFSDGRLFGSDGREDSGGGAYLCVDTQDFEPIWSEPNMPISHSIRVGNSVLVVGIDGRIWAIEGNATQWEPKWNIALPKGNYRPLPAFSQGLLVTRNTGPQSKWIAIRIDR